MNIVQFMEIEVGLKGDPHPVRFLRNLKPADVRRDLRLHQPSMNLEGQLQLGFFSLFGIDGSRRC